MLFSLNLKKRCSGRDQLTVLRGDAVLCESGLVLIKCKRGKNDPEGAQGIEWAKGCPLRIKPGSYVNFFFGY